MSSLTYVSLGTLLSLSLLAAPSPGEDITESKALEMLRENPRFRALRAGVPVAAAEARIRTRPPNPSFSFTYEGAGRTEFYQVAQELPVNGRRGILKQAGKFSVAVAEARAQDALRGVHAELRGSFYTLLLAQAREAEVAESIAELQRLATILRAREREGEGSRFDLLRAEREIAERSTDLDNTHIEVAREQIRLASYLRPGIAPGDLRAVGNLSPPADARPLHQLLSEALALRADYQLEEQERRRLGFEQKAAERRKIPNPVVLGGLKRADNVGPNLDNGAVLGVTLNLPLFNPGKAESELAMAEARRSRARQDALAVEIAAEVRAAHEGLRLRKEVLANYRRRIEDTTQTLRSIAEVSYGEGEAGILELLDSYRVAQQSRERLLDLMYAALLARIELDRAVGVEVPR